MPTKPTPEATREAIRKLGYKPVQTMETESQYAVTLWRHSKRGRLAVTYGCHYADNLTYTGAAEELGSCLMHALACNGLLDD